MKIPKAISKEQVGARLRAWRKEEGLRAYQVAEAIGISQGSYSEIETGKSHPSFLTIYRLMNSYKNHDIAWILFVI